jgi:hypothetical protein
MKYLQANSGSDCPFEQQYLLCLESPQYEPF